MACRSVAATDPIDDVAIIFRRPAPAAFASFTFDRQQTLQNPPFRFRQITATHDRSPESAVLNQTPIQASIILSTRPSTICELAGLKYYCNSGPIHLA